MVSYLIFISCINTRWLVVGLGSMQGGYWLDWVSPPGHPNHAQQNKSSKIILYSFFKILIFLTY